MSKNIPRITSFEQADDLTYDITRQKKYCRRGTYAEGGLVEYTALDLKAKGRERFKYNAKRYDLPDGSRAVKFYRNEDGKVPGDLMVAYYADGRVEVNHDCPGRDTWKIQNRLLPSTMQLSPKPQRAAKGVQRPFATLSPRTTPDIAPETLHVAFLLLDYDPATETFTWKKTGRPAGTLQRGYRKIQIKGNPIYAHQLATVWPDDEIIRQPSKL